MKSENARNKILKILSDGDWKSTRNIDYKSDIKNWNKTNLELTKLLYENKVERSEIGKSVAWRVKDGS